MSVILVRGVSIDLTESGEGVGAMGAGTWTSNRSVEDIAVEAQEKIRDEVEAAPGRKLIAVIPVPVPIRGDDDYPLDLLVIMEAE